MKFLFTCLPLFTVILTVSYLSACSGTEGPPVKPVQPIRPVAPVPPSMSASAVDSVTVIPAIATTRASSRIPRVIVPPLLPDPYDPGPLPYDPYPFEEPVPPKPVSYPQDPAQSGPYEFVEESADFPGGMTALKQYIASNMVYPPTAMEMGLEGKCYLRFVVSETGSISNIEVRRGVLSCKECDAEAIRLVKGMPVWKPAKNNGEPVSSYYNLPVKFQLQ